MKLGGVVPLRSRKAGDPQIRIHLSEKVIDSLRLIDSTGTFFFNCSLRFSLYPFSFSLLRGRLLKFSTFYFYLIYRDFARSERRDKLRGGGMWEGGRRRKWYDFYRVVSTSGSGPCGWRGKKAGKRLGGDLALNNCAVWFIYRRVVWTVYISVRKRLLFCGTKSETTEHVS